MRIIPRVYYHKDIIALINSYIDDGFTSYHSLPEIDQERISAECIKILGTDAYDCIIQSDDFDITLHHLKQYLLTGQREYALDLAETMSKNAVQYFTNIMDSLFSDMSSKKQYENNIACGLKISSNNLNGEIQWV